MLTLLIAWTGRVYCEVVLSCQLKNRVWLFPENVVKSIATCSTGF